MTVACITHGPMKYRFDARRYECVGFDGEGCDAPAVDEEKAFVDVTSIPDAAAKRLAVHWRALAARSQGREPGDGHG
jgi:hypothetical protein